MNDEGRSGWIAAARPFLVPVGVVIGVALLVLATLAYIQEWSWTGFTTPKLRTLWDWLELLIVPVVLALGGYLLTSSENRRTRELAERQRNVDREIGDQRAETDREIADQRRQDDMLQAYFNHMGELLLDKQRPLRESKESDEARTLARARTLSVVGRLNASRKGSLLLFLYEATLINRNRDGEGQAVISLSRADLTHADLREANLSETNLRNANLSNANLRSANLCGTDLGDADLSEAKLEFADLTQAKLHGANLSSTDMYGAKLSSADLTGANLQDANLYGTDLGSADLSEADLSGADLSAAKLPGAKGITSKKLEEQASSLEGTTMPNV